MTKLEIFKTVGGIIVSVGVGTIVGNAINATTPGTIGAVKKVLIGVGSAVLSGMVSDAASKYAENKIDETAEQIKGMVKKGDLD